MLGNLYNIERVTEVPGSTVFSVRLDPSDAVFDGHFPGRPVLPGVCSIQIIKDCAERIAGERLVLVNMIRCRFVSLIVPERQNILDVSVSLDGQDGGRRYLLKASVSISGKLRVSVQAECCDYDVFKSGCVETDE